MQIHIGVMHVVCLVLVSLQRQLGDLSHNVNADISPLCTCRKIKNAFGVKEGKLPLMNQQCIVYNFSVVCVMQVMSDIHAEDTYINTFKNTKHWQLETSEENMLYYMYKANSIINLPYRILYSLHFTV